MRLFEKDRISYVNNNDGNADIAKDLRVRASIAVLKIKFLFAVSTSQIRCWLEFLVPTILFLT